MSITSIPIVETAPDGTERIVGEVTHLCCANCDALTPVSQMLCDAQDGSWHCTECDGEDYLARARFRRVAAVADRLKSGNRFTARRKPWDGHR